MGLGRLDAAASRAPNGLGAAGDRSRFFGVVASAATAVAGVSGRRLGICPHARPSAHRHHAGHHHRAGYSVEYFGGVDGHLAGLVRLHAAAAGAPNRRVGPAAPLGGSSGGRRDRLDLPAVAPRGLLEHGASQPAGVGPSGGRAVRHLQRDRHHHHHRHAAEFVCVCVRVHRAEEHGPGA